MQGYGVNTLYDVFNVKHYAYIGSSWIKGGTGAGGCYYFPYIKKYMSAERAEEVETACNSGNVIPTNEEDQAAYSHYQIEDMVNYRERVFHIGQDECDIENIDLENIDASNIAELGQRIADKTVAKFDSYGYSQAKRGQEGFADCSSLVARAYAMFNINYFAKSGYYYTTYSERDWCKANNVLFTNTSTSNLMPGDLL